MPFGGLESALAGMAVGAAATLLATGWLRRGPPKGTAQTLDAQRQLLEALGNSRDGVALYDSANRLITCNDRYLQMLSPIKDSIRPGARFEDLMAELAEAEKMEDGWLARKLSGGGLTDATAGDDKFRDGQWITVNAYATSDGGQLRILRDITQRKQAEIALEDTVSWLRGVMDTVVDGIVTIDETGTVLSFNPAAEHLFGWAAEQVVGRNVSMLMPDPHQGAHDGYIRAYFSSKSGKVGANGREVEGLRRDGTHFPMELAIAHMHQGDMLTFIGVIRDISERKRSEKALRDSTTRLSHQANRLQAIIDNMPQGVAVFASDDALIALNESAIRMLGLPKAEITPGTIDISLFMALLAANDTPPGHHSAQLTADLSESIRERPEMVFEHFTPSGLIMEVRSSSMPGGGLILSFTDITDRKHIEQTLREAKDEAERGNRTKNTFLANISHELRTPLNAIIGFSEMMKHEIFGPLEPASYRAYVDDIHESGMHLLELINDILDMSKAEAGMTDLMETAVHVPDLIRAAIRLLNRRAENAAISLTEDLPPNLPTLLADERRLRQIILNLGSNAVKFTDDGGAVTIGAKVTEAGFVIRVADTGIGMTPEDVQRVMEPFVQADTRLSRKYEGSGLGLPLAKALVIAHGGTLNLDSQPGRGTVVTVTFPPSRIIDQSGSGADI
ncbi:Signal transduction histidine kinase [Paramagnetospirillum magnetotacticum MS-1]|uniref:Sensor protein FixL n=1 Tax=Paramagnetospirillum magnetotacticum MS-1 TaxID=272627 RepID=A0A0C2YUV0_PARME|nr:PAS-domain containing protein [Paramagnetospirillum magnetotacticum]KIL98475.1 Signal transduction histidine kinase [Paramagnetospirillum magnetotacticum MS-1]